MLSGHEGGDEGDQVGHYGWRFDIWGDCGKFEALADLLRVEGCAWLMEEGGTCHPPVGRGILQTDVRFDTIQWYRTIYHFK